MGVGVGVSVSVGDAMQGRCCVLCEVRARCNGSWALDALGYG
jgi:hypothetical protein